ncbi:hypothetical protein MIR68_004791 [Amoeboaphelidium protococcarum]|nr:hypothetical protein MIR68_004791 [Amoeboaphelidium protococcarum]
MENLKQLQGQFKETAEGYMRIMTEHEFTVYLWEKVYCRQGLTFQEADQTLPADEDFENEEDKAQFYKLLDKCKLKYVQCVEKDIAIIKSKPKRTRAWKENKILQAIEDPSSVVDLDIPCFYSEMNFSKAKRAEVNQKNWTRNGSKYNTKRRLARQEFIANKDACFDILSNLDLEVPQTFDCSNVYIIQAKQLLDAELTVEQVKERVDVKKAKRHELLSFKLYLDHAETRAQLKCAQESLMEQLQKLKLC